MPVTQSTEICPTCGHKKVVLHVSFDVTIDQVPIIKEEERLMKVESIKALWAKIHIPLFESKTMVEIADHYTVR